MRETQPLTEEERADLVAYLDGELDEQAAGVLERKLREDSRFRAEAATLQRTWAMLDSLPKPAPAPAFASRTLDRIAALPAPTVAISAAPSKRFERLGWAAALLAAAAIGYVLVPPARHEVNLDSDRTYAADPRLIENLPLYLAADNIDFLQLLDNADLFGDDAMGRE